jgi:hypothetical protein
VAEGACPASVDLLLLLHLDAARVLLRKAGRVHLRLLMLLHLALLLLLHEATSIGRVLRVLTQHCLVWQLLLVLLLLLLLRIASLLPARAGHVSAGTRCVGCVERCRRRVVELALLLLSLRPSITSRPVAAQAAWQ